MERKKINFEVRSQETQDILRNISGRGLKMGIYLFVLVFIAVVAAGSQVEFPSDHLVSAQKTAERTMRITSPLDAKTIAKEDIKSVTIGDATYACNLNINDNNQVDIFLQEDLPKITNEEIVQMKLVEDKKFLQIVFDNIF